VATYWGAASAVVYPIVLGTPEWVAMRDTMDVWTDLFGGAHPLSSAHTVAPWAGVHVTVALAIPGAVGLAALYRYGRRAATDRDAVRVVASALVVLLLLGYAGAGTYSTTVDAPQSETALVQYGQPTDDLSPLVERARAADVGPETDVYIYGTKMARTQYQRPLRWYFEAEGIEYEAATDTVALESEDPPPVVIAATESSLTATDPDAVTRVAPSYERVGTYTTRLPLEHRTLRLAVFAQPDQ
jgi:predicted membrane-bound mannosyltransferase